MTSQDRSVFGGVSFMVRYCLSLCLINEPPRQEEVWGSGNTAPSFLTPTLGRRSEWSASRPDHLTAREKGAGTY
jgi:hypothetical protein